MDYCRQCWFTKLKKAFLNDCFIVIIILIHKYLCVWLNKAAVNLVAIQLTAPSTFTTNTVTLCSSTGYITPWNYGVKPHKIRNLRCQPRYPGMIPELFNRSTNKFTLKLQAFWKQSEVTRFVQADAQFALREISANDIKCGSVT
ncbi:uncharacterized protein LOC132405140 isoform X2 [Hypanus sabinus]|uniref:uncharacterized protein LOC132405140 isoform X2 n=1 Tax=Hypanus sabinus TaxID=79690 RepID=UPI0028C415F5|nr:uncharacterized protein LOC132405140 isoform X2 [Hypanus sabinus]